MKQFTVLNRVQEVPSSDLGAPSLEYLWGSRTVTYNWPYHTGVSLLRLVNGGLMSDHPTALGGTCSGRFAPLRELFKAKLESGEDLGASVAVNINGEMVVDLWGGWTDEARSAPWTESTITNVFSTTKTMTALAALVLVDRGELDLNATVARYWPEFAARGKAGIKVSRLALFGARVSRSLVRPGSRSPVLDPRSN